MDYLDYEAGKSESGFWFKCKKEFIESILTKLNKTNLKILNIGSGTGDDLEVLNKFGEIYVIDINKKALNLIPREFIKEKKLCDASKLKFYSDNSFDLVVSFDVFEHIPEDKKAINEAFRVLKKGGFLIFSVPAFQILYSAHDKALNHRRRYSKKQISDLLNDFETKNLFYWNSLLFLPSAISRLINKNSAIKVDRGIKNKFIDNLFYKILKTENFLISKNIKFPIGLSIFGVCKK